VADCDRLQPGEPVAAAGATAADWQLVVDEPAAAVGKDGWSAPETRPVLLAAAGGESLDSTTLRHHGTADRAAALPRRVVTATWRRETWQSKGDGEVPKKSHGKRVNVLVNFTDAPLAAKWTAGVGRAELLSRTGR